VRSAEFLAPPLSNAAAVVTAVAATTNATAPTATLSHQSSSTSETRDELGDLEPVASQFVRGGGGLRDSDSSPKCHSRSSSHDSYFEQRKLSVQFKLDLDDEEEEDMQLNNNSSTLDISEIGVNFDLEDNEMKIFSEDEAMVSTSVGSELSLPRSPLEEISTSAGTTSTAIMTAATRADAPLRKSIESSNNSPFVRGTTTRNSEALLPLQPMAGAVKDELPSPTKSRRMSFKDKLRKFTSPTLQRKQQQQAPGSGSEVGHARHEESGLAERIGGGDSANYIPVPVPTSTLETKSSGGGEESTKSLKVIKCFFLFPPTPPLPLPPKKIGEITSSLFFV
jgi:hypothetical protein